MVTGSSIFRIMRRTGPSKTRRSLHSLMSLVRMKFLPDHRALNNAIRENNMRALKWRVASALVVLATVRLLAGPGTITTTLTPPGPILVGDQFTVTMSIGNYTDPTEIDGFNITGSYNTNLFMSVPNSFNLGGPPDPNVQWLSLPNQEPSGGGYTPVPFNDDSVPGLISIAMSDLGYNDPEHGTLASDGFLVSFQLKSIAKGTGNIQPAAFQSGTVLFNTDLSPAGVPAFSGATMTVTAISPPMGISLAGGNVTVSWPDPSTRFLPEC